MANFTRAFKNTAYQQSSVTLLLFFASWGVWWSFFQIWLTNEQSGLGLNGAEVGTVYSVNSLATLIVMFAYGTMQDRLGIKRYLAVGAAAIMALIGPFMIWVYQPLLQHAFWVGVILGSVVLSTAYLAAAGLLEALSERLSRSYGFEYGQARMWGSFGYAMVALVSGFLFTVNPHLNFWGASLFGLLCLLVLLFWRNTSTPLPGHHFEGASTPGLREMAGLLKMPALWQVIAFVFLSWTFYTVFDQQMFPEFYTNLFSTQERGQQVYGVLNSVQVFVEAAMLGVVPIIMRRVGVRTTLMLGITVMFVRILGCGLLTDAVTVSAAKMLHALEVPLMILPIFRYFTLHFNPKLSATLYMVGFQISSQIGNVVMSQPLGVLRDTIGYQPTFRVIAAVVLAAGIYGFFVLKKDDEAVLGDPFVRDAARRDAEKISV